jgi:6,7-dimethyl-8-ribityllumazine synthase
MDMNLRYNIPFIFGVLTCETIEQARDRAGGRHGNKGVEAAATAVKMMMVKNSLRK